jgi:LPXTG-motif cell wall-anchored protein
MLAIVITALMLFTSVGVALAQEPDPLKVMEAYDLALNEGNVDGALALFADDAVLTTQQGQLVGKEQIWTWLERVVAQNSRVEPVNRQVNGAKVTWQSNFFRKDIATLSNEPLAANAEAVVEAGKIKSFSSILTDEAQAKLAAAQPAPETTAAAPAQNTAAPAQDAAAQNAAVPPQLPQTGGTSPSALPFSGILVITGGLLLGMGLLVRRLAQIA